MDTVKASGLAALFFIVFNSTELELGASLGFRDWHPGALQIGGAFCDMKPEFLFHTTVKALAAEQPASVPL